MQHRIMIVALSALTLTACESITTPGEDGYELGATTRTYCETTDPTVREAGRRLAATAGIRLVDLCAAYSYITKRPQP